MTIYTIKTNPLAAGYQSVDVWVNGWTDYKVL